MNAATAREDRSPTGRHAQGCDLPLGFGRGATPVPILADDEEWKPIILEPAQGWLPEVKRMPVVPEPDAQLLDAFCRLSGEDLQRWLDTHPDVVAATSGEPDILHALEPWAQTILTMDEIGYFETIERVEWAMLCEAEAERVKQGGQPVLAIAA